MEIDEKSLNDKNVIFRDFLNSIMEFRTWPRSKTHAFVKVNGGDTKYFTNETKVKHAEKIIVDTCLKHLPENTNVKIVINYSPCKKCSYYINNFLSESPNIKLEIVFAGLYFIYRKVPHPSGNLQLYLGGPNTSENNITGLIELSRKVNLRNFSREDWEYIWNTLKLDRLSADERRTMWNFVLEDKDYPRTFSNEVEMIRTRLRDDELVKMELEIMLGDCESDNHVQEALDFIKKGTFESDNHVQELMDFFNRELPVAELPPAELPPAELPPAELPPAELPPAELPPAGEADELVRAVEGLKV